MLKKSLLAVLLAAFVAGPVFAKKKPKEVKSTTEAATPAPAPADAAAKEVKEVKHEETPAATEVKKEAAPAK